MPPMCTPEKTNETTITYTFEQLYYNNLQREQQIQLHNRLEAQLIYLNHQSIGQSYYNIPEQTGRMLANNIQETTQSHFQVTPQLNSNNIHPNPTQEREINNIYEPPQLYSDIQAGQSNVNPSQQQFHNTQVTPIYINYQQEGELQSLYLNNCDGEEPALILSDCGSEGESDEEEDEQAKDRMDKLMLDFPQLTTIFDLNGQVGEGTFSTVYSASLKNSVPDTRFAIKQVVPTCHPDRIKFELQCLKEIGGTDNVAGIHFCLRNKNNVLFIMPFQRHMTFSEYVGDMEVGEVALYMKNLLIALARVHKFGVIHRDIKPSNFLYDREFQQFMLVDFGLAQKQPESKPEQKKVEVLPKMPSSTKRKRDPFSPLNGVIQEKKRHTVGPSLTNTPVPSSSSKSMMARLSQKENDPKFINNTPKESNPLKGNLQYIKFDSSPEMKPMSEQCKCYGKPTVCSACVTGKPMIASRAGTPGFRPPEVLLKYPHQTTAVDIWGAGTIMLSILSNCSNFFTCPNDIAALLEMITIFGYENMRKVANQLGRYFIVSETKPALDLRKICCTLKSRGSKLKTAFKGDRCGRCKQYITICLCPNVPLHKDIEDIFPASAYDLLHKLLDLNPATRITAEEALKHPFLNEPY